MHKRTPYGGLFSDAPSWTVEAAPVLPSLHRKISSNLWNTMNCCYKEYPEESDYKANLVDHGPKVPVKDFAQPKDAFGKYTESVFQFGNQQIMRKGGSSMAPKKS